MNKGGLTRKMIVRLCSVMVVKTLLCLKNEITGKTYRVHIICYELYMLFPHTLKVLKQTIIKKED